MNDTSSSADVLFEEIPGNQGNLGIILLNRPQVLNSLNHSMVLAIHHQLEVWATLPTIKAVIIRALEGRAFCAGGDLRLTYDRMKSKDKHRFDFFRDEYQLNRLIYHYPKPYIALLDGITMGGGVGISIHGSHRIATERLLFAMPETGIGFFPDVGGSYFLPRINNYLGIYLGLTGTKITSDDCIAIGLADIKIAKEEINDLIHACAQQPFNPDDPRRSVTNIIEPFRREVKFSTLTSHQQIIGTCFASKTVEEIIRLLQQNNTSLANEIIASLQKKSPTSLKVSLRAMQQGKQLDFDACMQLEYRLVTHFVDGHDFAEGIRAVIIDKDQTPIWNPAKLPEVSNSVVDNYFN